MTSAAMVTVPTERGGWWHNYVCPIHGGELIHEGLLEGRFPDGGVSCVHGCRVDSPEVRGAWTVLAHQACARQILILARSSSSVSQNRALAMLLDYNRLYVSLGTDAHEGAQSWMLRGRLFQQALTEAIWAVTVGQAARALAMSKVDGLADLLPLLKGVVDAARSARAILVGEGKFHSNYTAWLNAAGAVCSSAVAQIQHTSADRSWLTDESGVYEHVLASTHLDGWEWEGSTYYHAFVLRAYLLALRHSGYRDMPATVHARISAMASVFATIKTSGGLVPALHDSPYERSDTAAEYAEVQSLVEEFGLTGAPNDAVVRVFPDAGHAVLKGFGIHAIVDFGPHGGPHGHRDKLSLYLYGARTPWQPDPGQVPYGHRAMRAYYASTAAHPTFTVDGKDQAECAGRLISAEPDEITVAVYEAYPGVTATRRVSLRDGCLVDELTVRCDRPSVVTVHLRPDVPLVARAQGNARTTEWIGGQRLHGEHTVRGAPACFLVRPGRAPADDPNRTRVHIDWTSEPTADVTFRSVYRVVGGEL
ncbi:heparinase II/III-family protein [Allokutzneria sp. A3M-2-11 16]|uniref:heparinase II/III domain-containing protein n=1 Tax=Allokutzneria sp. A3M-2-11 16 TaxID=2962043 RepID=UPI0020B8AEC5|nr:heparinase II/III family protein [Allokutzneria sp. A3M-2-11 16]MCP3801186.1 heparinase II/III-family protein [Allokutzneria sp. A3M-2-11 16]